jgi:ribosomal protein L21
MYAVFQSGGKQHRVSEYKKALISLAYLSVDRTY